LTAELKGLNRDKGKTELDSSIAAQDKTFYADRSKTTHAKSSIKDKENGSTDELFQIIRSVNAKAHYKVDRFFYVDEDIHELFIKLKGHTRLKISHLVSSLLEDFILEHHAAIKEIISRKQNKFLD
jgi:hypothetical protein